MGVEGARVLPGDSHPRQCPGAAPASAERSPMRKPGGQSHRVPPHKRKGTRASPAEAGGPEQCTGRARASSAGPPRGPGARPRQSFPAACPAGSSRPGHRGCALPPGEGRPPACANVSDGSPSTPRRAASVRKRPLWGCGERLAWGPRVAVALLPGSPPTLSCRGQTAVVTLLSAPPTKSPTRDREGGTPFFPASGGVAAVVVAKEGQGAQAHDTRPPWPGWDGRAGSPAPLCQLSALSSALGLVSARLLGVPLLPRPRAREPPRTTVLSTHTATRAPSHMLKAQGPAQEGPHGPKIGSVGLHPCRCTAAREGPGRQ